MCRIFLNGSSIVGMSERSFERWTFCGRNQFVRRTFTRHYHFSRCIRKEQSCSISSGRVAGTSLWPERLIVPSCSFDEPKKCWRIFLNGSSILSKSATGAGRINSLSGGSARTRDQSDLHKRNFHFGRRNTTAEEAATRMLPPCRLSAGMTLAAALCDWGNNFSHIKIYPHSRHL